MVSYFNIICKNWEDPQKVKSYNFYFLTKKDDGSTSRVSIASTSLGTLNAVLPFGTFEIRVEIWDTLDAFIDVPIKNISTVMPTKEEVDAFNITEKINAMSGSSLIPMYIMAQNSINKNANWTSLDVTSLSAKSPEERTSLFLTLNENTANQLKSLESTNAPSTGNQVTMAMDTISSAVQSVLDNPIASLTIDMGTRETAISLFERTTDSLDNIKVQSPDQLIPSLRSALNIFTAITTGINTILLNQDAAPPKDLLEVADSFYDAEAEVGVDIPDTEEEQIKANVFELMKLQAQSQTDRMMASIDKICSHIQKKLVKGEKIEVLAESGSSVVIERIGEEVLENRKEILSPDPQRRVSLMLPPNFCPSRTSDVYTECNSEFDIRLTVFPLLTHAFSETINYISRDTCVVNVDVYSEGTLVHITNETLLLEDAIYISIPRLPEAKLDDPLYVNVTDSLNEHIPVVYHFFNITRPQAAYAVEISPSVLTEDLVILVGHKKYPSPKKHEEIFFMNELTYYDGTFYFVVSTFQNKNSTGTFILGVGKLRSGVAHGNITETDLDENFNSNYELRVLSTGCYYYNTFYELWSDELDVAAIEVNRTHTNCSTLHFSEFGLGNFFLPNKINYELLIANMGFIDNSTLYIVLILLLVVYIGMMIWGHYKDRKDFERRGAVPLPDNKVEDKYLYEITFHTGPDSDAPCESNIWIIVSGDCGETDVRQLPPANRNLYRRYDRNTLVMACPASLGPVHYLRVFHDNSGRPPHDSWQLERVIVNDIQKHECYIFETNAWLALDRGDGLVDRVFACSNYNADSISFSQMMYNQTHRGVNQDHIWLSMFLRPVGSRYSRKERVTVGAVFLYLSMVLSAMYYHVEGEQPQDDGFYELGPITFTFNRILTSMLIIIMTYPVTMILTTIFKRARPRNLKRCRVLDAIEKQKREQLIESGMNEADASEKSKVDEKENATPKRKVELHTWCLPWWTRILSWIVSITAIITSAVFVWSFGITWGEITTTKWFASFFITFALSLVVSQWIKVLCYSLCAAMCMKTDQAFEDMDCDEELPQLKEDESWHDEELLDSSAVRKVYLVKGVERRKGVKNLSIALTNNRDMKYVVKGILVYCLFLGVLIIIASNRTDKNAFYMKRHMVNTFIKEGHLEFDLINKVMIKI